MIRSSLRWVLILGCLVVLGPLALRLTGGLRDASGGPATTLLVNATPGPAAVAGVVSLALAAGAGVLGGWAFSMGTGLACAGLVLAWARWGLGTLDSIVRRAGDGSDLTALGVEGLAAGLLALGVCTLVVGVSNRRQPDGGKGRGLLVLEAEGDSTRRNATVAGVLAGAGAGALVIWLCAVTELRGQTLLAVVIGGIGAGAASHLVGNSMRTTLSPVPAVAGLTLVALASPLVAKGMHGDSVLAAVFGGKVLPLARPVSLDWAAGALLGVPVGMGWAGAVLDVRAAEEPAESQAEAAGR
ncbi:MAG: hypothetical protein IT433_00995 [Phycisphaerales bacterium]|nr:hypothetical protein [Phycisphaerales bacterium]